MAKKLFISLIALLTTSLASVAQYTTLAQTPKANIFLPAPPAYTDTRFSPDIQRYFFGKQVQIYDTKRAAQIKVDVTYGATALAERFAPMMGYTLSSTNGPTQWVFFSNSVTSAGYGSNTPKSYYARMRPCVRFNEAPYSTETLSEMKRSYSYPSSHAMTGWGGGMIMAALNPTNQDTILSRAFQYGQSRVLGGMHWQSDVTDARIIASACVARMLNVDMFTRHIEQARTEATRMLKDSLNIDPPAYDASDYYSADNMPDALRYLPEPCDLYKATPDQAYDMSQYIWGKSIRETDRGKKAQFDTSNDFDVLVSEFAHAIGNPIDSIQTPELYSLLQYAITASENGCTKACDHYGRIRPFEYFKDKAYTFENQDEILKQGSYPSVNASRAWMAALMVTAVAPARQDTILNVGYELGQSCVIAGINWQSDVEAGRLVASAALSRLMSNPEFIQKVIAARNEYTASSHNIVTNEMDLPVDQDIKKDAPLFTIDGRRATEESKGILVGRGRKIISR